VYWDRLLVCFVPRELRGVEVDRHLAGESGVGFADVRFLHYIRDRCGHPIERGWPTQRELDQALAYARRIWLALAPPEPAPPIDLGEASMRREAKDTTAGRFADWAVMDDPFPDLIDETEPGEADSITVAQLASELGMDPFDVLDKLDRWFGMYVLSTASAVAGDKAEAFRSRLAREATPP
jgi:hypothetical protein